MPGNSTNIRILLSRILGVLVLALLLVTDRHYSIGVGGQVLSLAGLAVIIAAALGRIWTSSYLAGYKDARLIRYGPFSVTRNPLYLFTLLAAAGIGIAAASLVILLLATGIVAITHSVAVKKEEARLAELFGKEYEDYRNSVPRFWPQLNLYESPKIIFVNMKIYGKAFIDATGWLAVYLGLRAIDLLHVQGVLPTLFEIP